MKCLITGGARSGKSRRALSLALTLKEELATIDACPLHFVATAQAFDDEMRQRISHHKAERDDSWCTHETPLQLIEALDTISNPAIVVVDCLTLWLSNLMFKDVDIEAETQALCTFVEASELSLIFVTNEVGMGIVPESKLGREFRDAQGRLNQRLAEVVNQVELVVAGLPLVIKS